ncbi:cdc20/fizzy protein cortex isoform 1-T1 [Glossina fuscipes fuscipes]
MFTYDKLNESNAFIIIAIMVTIKRRRDTWENEVREIKLSSADMLSMFYGDRFIPRRCTFVKTQLNLKFSQKRDTVDILNVVQNQDYWRENAYIPVLKDMIEVKSERILQLTDPSLRTSGIPACEKRRVRNDKYFDNYDWPCIPRLKPSIYADKTFDLPDYNTFCEENMIDWSVNGQIAVLFGHDVMIWKSKEDITMVFNVRYPSALAYSPNGEYLAISCKTGEHPVVELWDVQSPSFSVQSGQIFEQKYNHILALAWDRPGTHLVCGSHFGTIFVLSAPNMNIIMKFHKHYLPITIIRFSPNRRYMASGDEEGNLVVYNWGSCSVHLYIYSRRGLRVVFDWHPWTDSDLVISEKVPASIILLHVPSKKIVGYYQQADRRTIINSISFSKLTGELLVSISNRIGNVNYNHKILVMASLDRVVDVIAFAHGNARFLVWSPDGTHVATSGNEDETLTMWNFCARNRKRFPQNAPYTPNFHLSECNFGSQFKKWNNVK